MSMGKLSGKPDEMLGVTFQKISIPSSDTPSSSNRTKLRLGGPQGSSTGFAFSSQLVYPVLLYPGSSE